jgi:Tol biopolymer transport system component
LTTDSGLTTGATISPDGKLVAYASDRGASDNLDVYVQQVDSGGVVRITSDPADDYDPTFSADGAQIAFRSDREGSGIYIAPALGGEARLLVPKGRRPRFSPDGRLLMYYLGPENS